MLQLMQDTVYMREKSARPIYVLWQLQRHEIWVCTMELNTCVQPAMTARDLHACAASVQWKVDVYAWYRKAATICNVCSGSGRVSQQHSIDGQLCTSVV